MVDAIGGTAAAAVSVTGLSKRYRDLVALDGVSLTAPRGSVTCLVGPNGSGKTTLVECVEGLRRPDRGRIEILGEEYPYGRKRPPGLGVQLQEESLPTRIRVGEALTFFRRLYQAPDLPQEWLATLGVDALWRRPFRQLSGGEKRRVAVALALVARPAAVVLDEPTANLDPDGQDAVMRVIGQLRAHRAGVLVSMHDMAHAARIADRVVVMVAGRIAAAGRPADLVAALPGSACVVLPAEATVPPRLRRQAEAEVVYRERRFLYGGEELLGFAALPDGAEARRASLVDVLAGAAGTAAAREVGRVP